MTRDELFPRVQAILAETFELDAAQITAEARLYEDLELDSIDALDMIVRLQELTGRRLGEDEMRSLRTVEDVVALVHRMHQQPEQQVG